MQSEEVPLVHDDEEEKGLEFDANEEPQLDMQHLKLLAERVMQQ